MVGFMQELALPVTEGKMRTKRFKVELTEGECAELMSLIRGGVAPARTIRRAHVLLRASEDAYDHESAAALHISVI